MGKSFDFLLTAAALIAGILLLTGHGDFLLKGGNSELRKAKYDEAKMTNGIRNHLCDSVTARYGRTWTLPQIQMQKEIKIIKTGAWKRFRSFHAPVTFQDIF